MSRPTRVRITRAGSPELRECLNGSPDLCQCRTTACGCLQSSITKIKYADRRLRFRRGVSVRKKVVVACRRGLVSHGLTERSSNVFYRAPGLVMARVKGTGWAFSSFTRRERHGGRVFAESAGVGQGSLLRLNTER